MEGTDPFWYLIYTAFSDACATQTFCQAPALWASMFPRQTQKAHFMPESPRMQKISFKAQG